MATTAETKLSDSKNKLREIFSQRKRIIDAIQTANNALATASDQVALTEDAAADELAASAVSTDAKPSQSILARLLNFRQTADLSTLTVRGLQKKLDDLDASVPAAIDCFDAARMERASELKGAFDLEYRKAVTTFAATMRRGLAIGVAIGDETMRTACERGSALDLTTLEEITEPRRVVNSAETNYPDWEADPKAAALFQAYKSAQDLAKVLRAGYGSETFPRSAWLESIDKALAA